MNKKSVERTYEISSREEEILNSISHGVGIPLGLLALGLLLKQAIALQEWTYIIAVLVYGLSFTWTYLISTLYHLSHNSNVKLRNRLHLLDHLAIYFFIAGTYTPIAIYALPEIWNLGILIGVWSLAIGGSLLKIYSIGKMPKLSLAFYLLMGSMILIAAKPLFDNAPLQMIYWILAGGVFYTTGTLFFSWRSLKFGHAVWHLFVLGGSICHFFAIYKYLPDLIS